MLEHTLLPAHAAARAKITLYADEAPMRRASVAAADGAAARLAGAMAELEVPDNAAK